MKNILLLVTLLLANVCADAAELASSKLPRSTPEAQGISSAAVQKFVEEADAKVDAMHSFMLVRHGHVVAESWWAPYAAEEPHMLYSLSKSFTSTAVGLAVAEEKLNIDALVLSFFPDEAPAAPDKNLQQMRVRDLLSMSTGQHDDDIKAFPFGSQENLVKRFLAVPVAHKPGTHFVYNTPATYMLSAIVQKVTGQSVLEYLRPRLFEPLGIAHPTWEASAQGISLGGFGLSIRTEDIANFGQLYLQRGQWHGKQLLPAAWVDTATARQTSNGSNPESDWDQGYGYQFWRCRHGFYRADGAFGQFCIVMPEYDAVVAITSGTKNMAQVMNLVWEHIVPALKATPLAADAAAQTKLREKLTHLALPPQRGTATSPTAQIVAGHPYVFPANQFGIERISIDAPAADGSFTATTRMGGTEQKVTAGFGEWRKGAHKNGSMTEPIAASGAWTSEDTYTLQVSRYQTPFLMTYQLRFSGDELVLNVEQNVGFGDTKLPPLVGKKE